ncbi:MAG: sel1 repeat family protein [Nitrospirae bacterium]|nr:sel1 repeat family protein [Nitrospirota bacterium]MDE3041584.1 sel1 repeat family protein [Nitrospirota bacterium]MDE3219641.1 sel1 repeat family protein [Nitrospirota bacterium]
MWLVIFAVILVVSGATVEAADIPQYIHDAYEACNDRTGEVQRCRSLAEQGNPAASYDLAEMYDKGKGFPQDHQEALKWFRLAAQNGAPSAQFNLGTMYLNGVGVPQNLVLAHMWFNIAVTSAERYDFVPGAVQAKELRDFVGARITATQLQKAQETARRCYETKFKECG